MKKSLLFLFAVLISTGTLLAQTPQVPDFKNQPMVLKADGSLDKLEKQASELKTKNVPYVGVTRFISITDGKSPVRLGKDAVFIIKVDAETDPETLIYLTKTVGAGKKNREIDMEKTSAYAGYGAKGKSVKKNNVQLTFEKVSPGVYKIIPTGLESKTEYGFVPVEQGASGAHSTIYLFGVN